MDKRQEAEQKWKNHFNKRFEEILKGENGTIKGSFQATGVSDYKSALKKDVKKKFIIAGIPRDELTLTIKELFDLIDEVTPK